MTRVIRTYHDVEPTPPDHTLPAQIRRQAERVAERLADVRHLVVVASGKGGVGKSFVAANLAAALAARGHRTGALDADLHGPSLAAMLGAARAPLRVDDAGVHPAASASGCRVISTDLLLASPDAPMQWHGPDEAAFVVESSLEAGTLREFLSDVAWGELDYLVLDLPPGTDKLARALGLLPRTAAVLLVTTPAAAADRVVRRSEAYLRGAGVTRAALVRNMDATVCTSCGAVQPLFAEAAQPRAAGLPCWASIPFDRELAHATDAGLAGPPPAGPGASAFQALVDRLEHEVAEAP